ncbi:MAG TPA: GAF domain-containing protein [Candidatus Dormibacteraeota bacterium]|nr:GAF domain-containing protein [Candidatus Dormibacteraeota bacterium]
METVRSDAGLWDLLDSFQSVSRELTKLNDVPAVAEAALQLALELTESAVAFIGLVDASGEPTQVYSRTADSTDSLPREEIERIVAATAAPAAPAANTIELNWSRYTNPGARVFRSYCGQPLVAGGNTIGMIGVASPSGYKAAQRRAFGVFANQVAAAVQIALLEERRKEMVDALVNLRADLDRSERERLVNQERVESAERVERAHEAAVEALLAVSVHARTGHTLNDFYRRLTTSIATLVQAEKVLFWQVGEGTLAPIRGSHGIDDAFLSPLRPVPCAPDRDDLASRVVFHDHVFRASRDDAAGDFASALDTLNVPDALAVSWRAGDQRLGLVAAYHSRRTGGFTREDGWVLQKAGLAAGLVWQLRHAETDLKKTVERLEKIDAARQLLLKNVSTEVDKTRRRLAAELHDDALQKLTAAELKLQRLRERNGSGDTILDDAQDLLTQTEDALRRVLFEVRPPALELPGGFEETIRDRITILRSVSGAEVELDLDVPDELDYQLKSMLFRQVVEAVTNIEKHAAATRVQVSLHLAEGAVHGRVTDNGKGFVVAERDHLPGHLGLLALNERSVLAGGWTRITSEPGIGTTVEFWMPIA